MFLIYRKNKIKYQSNYESITSISGKINQFNENIDLKNEKCFISFSSILAQGPVDKVGPEFWKASSWKIYDKDKVVIC